MKISVLIPCYNGEKVIKRCVQSCLEQTRKADQIVVVNDGSTDKTAKILKSFGRKIKVVTNRKNSGNKSHAQEKGLKHVIGDIFISIDSDTLMDKNFIKRVELAFADKTVIAFSGYVKSIKQNWLTACREIDYIISQNIHKKAQSFINAIFVIPGTAAAYRTVYFKTFCTFDHDTLTEDLDFTYKIHNYDLKIKYDKKAIVYTQDPDNFHSYVNQMRRWYSGGWQNLLKHRRIFRKPQNALELSLVYLETLIFSVFIYLLPLANIQYYFYLAVPYIMITAIFVLYAAYLHRRLDLVLSFPFYLFIIYVNSYLFVEQFFKEVVLRKRNLVWFHPERRAFT